jgi:antitoxin VapB
MSLNIKDAQADRLVRELAAETGESITTAVAVSARERLERVRGSVPREQRLRQIHVISARSAALAVRDERSAEDILGYDEAGLPR